jgi:hypothetical protein
VAPKNLRRRSRYAADRQVRRALRVAREEGFNLAELRLHADGTLTLRVDSKPAAASVQHQEEETPDEALARWERENELAGGA